MNLPQGQYRSDSIRRYAERVANHDTVGSLKINIDIDQILLKRDPRVGEVIMKCIEKKVAFMLYADAKHYAIIDPAKRLVACYSTGKQETKELAQTDQQFANRVRMAYAVYDKVYLPPLALVKNIESTAIPANRPTMISMIPIFILFFLFAACQTQEKKDIMPPTTVDSATIRLEPLRNDTPVLHYTDTTVTATAFDAMASVKQGRLPPNVFTPHPVRFLQNTTNKRFLENTTKPRQITIGGKPYLIVPIANGEYELHPLFDTTADPNYILVPRPKMPKSAGQIQKNDTVCFFNKDKIIHFFDKNKRALSHYIDTIFPVQRRNDFEIKGDGTPENPYVY